MDGANLYAQNFHGADGPVRQPIASALLNWQRSNMRWLRMMPARAATPVIPGNRPPTTGHAQELEFGANGPGSPNAVSGAINEGGLTSEFD